MNPRPNRGANGRGGSKWIRPEKRLAIYHRDDFTCLYCLRGELDGVLLTLDHVTPRFDGGSNEADNLVTACLTCNSTHRGLGPLSLATRARISLATAKPLDMKRGKYLRAERKATSR